MPRGVFTNHLGRWVDVNPVANDLFPIRIRARYLPVGAHVY